MLNVNDQKRFLAKKKTVSYGRHFKGILIFYVSIFQ